MQYDAMQTIHLGTGPSLGDAFRMDFNFASTGGGNFIGQCSLFYALREIVSGAVWPADGYNLLCQKGVAAFPQIKAYVATTVKLRDVQLVGVSNEGAVGSAQSDESGTGLTSSTPPQCAVLTAYSTNKKGRRFRGRNYWPGLATSRHDGGALDNDTAAHYASFVAHLLSTLTVDKNRVPQFTFRHVVYTRAIRDLPAEFNDVTGYAVRGQMATQRRRVRG